MHEANSDSESDSQPSRRSLINKPEEYQSFPIVGIGASAGGLQAFTQLLSALPTDTGMGFVLVQHLSPNHKSLLSQLLSKVTQMQVQQVEAEMVVEPNQIYIIPPNRSMKIRQGRLQLMPRTKTLGKNMPIDTFLESLATDLENKAIGIVLSGMDGDGTLGLEAIKAAGGITFAQSEQSAQFQIMPQTAIAGGCVDFILSPQEIAQELVKISRHPYLADSKAIQIDELASEYENGLLEIFRLLVQATGVDFTDYKHSTIKRRLKRRIVLHKLTNLEDYITYLQENPDEAIALYQDILINVTSFFRDSEAFEVLKQQVFPTLMLNRTANEPIRIWVPGCSTGEEVYSIAICLQEFLETQTIRPPIKILATDISDLAIQKARSGVYTERDIAQVSPERLQQFFVKVEDGYKIINQFRERCVFAKQNVIQDSPFSQLDLISCRNMLIYLGTNLQKKVLSLFHYALKPKSFLMLGKAETVRGCSDLFELVDHNSKIYTRKSAQFQLNFNFAAQNLPVEKLQNNSITHEYSWSNMDVQKKVDNILLNRYAPGGVVVNCDLEIIQFRGQTSIYLQPVSGQASLNLLKMVREGLLLDLREALQQAKDQNIRVRKEGLRFRGDEKFQEVNIDITPFQTALDEIYFLVLFEDTNRPANKSKVITKGVKKNKKGKSQKQQSALEQENFYLRQELANTKEYLQSINEQQEIANAELQATNEELLSSNEEFQSTNEELETAKEEIQATNEELNTINEELQSRNQEITEVNNDLNNLLHSVNIAIVMFGLDLSVRLVTPKAKEVLHISTDIERQRSESVDISAALPAAITSPKGLGEVVTHIQSHINVPNLVALITETINTASVIEMEVQDFSSHWYKLRLLPYKTVENKIDGVVIALTDIDALKKINADLLLARDFAEAMIDTVHQPLLALDPEWRVKRANHAYYQTFQSAPEETEQQAIFELGNGQWDLPALHHLLAEIISKDTPLKDFEVSQEFTHIGYKTMLLNACKIPPYGGPVQLVLLAIEDITERKQIEQQRQELLTQSQAAREACEEANKVKEQFISVLAHELRSPLSAILGWTQMLLTRNLNQSKTERALETIERSAKMQSKLLEDVLDLSRISTGKLKLNLHPINLISVIEAAISVAQVSADANNIHIEFLVVDPAMPKVMADSDRLHQVIWNLLSNAIKFTPSAGQITVRLEVVGDYAQMQVNDTGMGIAPEFLPYVFDRYRQAEMAYQLQNAGLGLGLALVRYLVELHQGNVEVASAGEGKGSTFTVKLPLSQEQDQKIKNKLEVDRSVSAREDTPVASLNGLDVLVVDDQPEVRELLKAILSEYDAQVTVVASAREALALLTEDTGGRKPNILISDIEMPEVDGYTFMQQVRSLPATQGGQILAVALSGDTRLETRIRVLQVGFQSHVPKPIEPAFLVAVIASLVGRQNLN